MKKDILYINSLLDIKIIDMLRTTSKDKGLSNLIILTILSAGAGAGTPIFSKDASGTTVFSSIDEIGTKFILDGKEVTSDDFLVVTKSQYGTNYNFFGLLFEDSNEHTLKISLVNSKIPNFQRIDVGPGYSANSITSVVIGNSITEINDSVFYDCTALTSIIIGNSVTKIGGSAFSGCTGLTSITIPNSVTTIGQYAFSRCTGLTSVTLGKSVTEIGSHAFEGCTGLTSMVVKSENPKYDSRNNCNAIIETASNTLICGCKNTIIPNSVTEIGNYAFSYCSGLTSVTIPNSVTEIGEWAFSGCTGLTSITIPDSVTSIGDDVFWGCAGLTSITSLAITAPTISNTTFNSVRSGGTLHVPAGSDYSAWMSTSNYYLGKYNWTKVEDA